jgi:hypothetical protein
MIFLTLKKQKNSMIFINTSQVTEEPWGTNDFVKEGEQIIS